MNFVFVFLLSLFLTNSAFGQSPLAEPNKSPSDEIERAFQREYAYLVSQKEALVRQREFTRKNLEAHTNDNKRLVAKLQTEIVQLTADNDDLHEQLVNLEKRKKELERRGISIESTYKKAQTIIKQMQADLKFESPPANKNSGLSGLPVNDNLTSGDLKPLFSEAQRLLHESADVALFSTSYIDQNDQLVEGPVVRVGKTAAYAEHEGTRYLLGPNGSGTLKVLETASKNGIYLFESMKEIAQVQKKPGWTENLADASPALFLSLMFLLVTGLFGVMVKM